MALGQGTGIVEPVTDHAYYLTAFFKGSDIFQLAYGARIEVEPCLGAE